MTTIANRLAQSIYYFRRESRNRGTLPAIYLGRSEFAELTLEHPKELNPNVDGSFVFEGCKVFLVDSPYHFNVVEYQGK